MPAPRMPESLSLDVLGEKRNLENVAEPLGWEWSIWRDWSTGTGQCSGLLQVVVYVVTFADTKYDT